MSTMNKIYRFRGMPIILIWLMGFLLSCNNKSDPSHEMLAFYSFQFLNTPQPKSLAGEYLDESISYRVNNNLEASEDSSRVIFEVVRGSGSVTKSTVYTDEEGVASTRWKLGTSSCSQVLRASTYDLSGKYLSSTDFVAYGFRLNRWDTISLSPDAEISYMVADTTNKITFMVTNSKLYRQGANYFEWELIEDPGVPSPRTIEIDGNGIMFITTWKGDLYKSSDHGGSWQKCTKPFPDMSEPVYSYVSKDNYVWIFTFDRLLRYSKDLGETWLTVESGLPASEGIGDVFRLSNGTLLFHGSSCCSLYRSTDDGKNWTHINAPQSSHKLYVDNKDQIYIVTQENMGEAIYKSTDLGQAYTRVCYVPVGFRTSMENIFNRTGNVYYVLIPGYGILKSYDLTTYEEYFPNGNLRNLFIDHNGVLIAKHHNWKTVYYRKNSE